MRKPDKKEVALESDSKYFQRALDMEALGLMAIKPADKYKIEVDCVLAPGQSSFSKLPQGAKILDLACGRGQTSKLVKDRGYDVTGADFSETAIEEAKKNPENRGINYMVGDMKNPPKTDGGYDAITCFGRSLAYFENYEEYMETLKSWHGALKDNGKIAIEWTEWEKGKDGGKWHSLGGMAMKTEPYDHIINEQTGEELNWGPGKMGQDVHVRNLKYPGEQLPGPVEIHRDQRFYTDPEGNKHVLGEESSFFVDLLRKRNFPLLKRMIEEVGFKNVQLVESQRPLTPPGNPMKCNVYAITAEKVSERSKIGNIVHGIRKKLSV